MNSEKLNTYLTVGANLAVLIGLVFVGIELRNSNASIAAQTNYSITEGFNSINMALAGDPELMRINVVGDQEPEKLTACKQPVKCSIGIFPNGRVGKCSCEILGI